MENNNKQQNKGNQPQGPNSKKLFFFMLILSVVMLFLWLYKDIGGNDTISYSSFIESVKKGLLVTEKNRPLVIFDSGKITGYIKTNEGTSEKFKTNIPPLFDNGELYKLLTDSQYRYTFKAENEQNPLFSMFLLNILPIGILFLIIWFMFRQVQGGGNKAFSFGKSKAEI